MTRDNRGQEWRYLRGGKRVHAIGPEGCLTGNRVALCGTEPGWFADWLGTGTQIEYETVEALPQCVRCLRKLQPVGA